MSLFKNVNVVTYYVSDWEKAKKFYAEVLEWPVAWDGDELGWYEFGVDNATHIAISRWNGPEPVPINGPLAVLSVDNAHQVAEKLRARGVKVDDVIDIPGVVSYGAFYDLEGNHFQFAASNPVT